ncbi:nitrous oxide reductase family maturation protein NosD [Bradyrhizobium canariense]|uniref:Nitrous oxidase accessory protein n=1 Tax=Bradyrhizobium canariense TaxID=255045 RepID=A0A1H2BFW3_9BRAD|nr:nitrous oxide reductase family maturation protein NosD [Bradyrhizobium canariense]SDT57145.1 nitrous oxidase accessory protein [Bradyrhizobium canariense]
MMQAWRYRSGLLGALLLLPVGPALASKVEVSPGDNLQAVISAAAAGDVLELQAGVYDGPVHVDRPLTLKGGPGVVVDGHGQGRTVEVTSPSVIVDHLVVRNSGRSLDRMDAGIFLDQAAVNAVVRNNTMEDNLVGVYVHGAPGALVQGNRISGWIAPNLNDSGNGVYVWNAPGAKILDNNITGGRDGIFVNVSRQNVFSGNQMRGVRIAIHYMYANNSEVSNNVSIGNHDGYVIMFSDHLTVRDNASFGDRDHGMLFNYANDSQIEGNAVRGGDQCVFIYNANKNRFAHNWFERCSIGVHFTAGSERNVMTNNAFISNRTQVKYVGTRNLEWSEGGRGNYWSDNPAFDLRGHGVADLAYRPNDLVDQVVWRYPAAKLLLNSPAVQVLRLAQSAFPNLHPGGVVDSFPLMKPPDVPTAHSSAFERSD